MRLTRQKREKSSSVLNLPAMIDVVMLILVFFMVTSSFNRPEQHVDADVTAPAGAGLTPADFEPIEIEIRAGGTGLQLFCDGQLCDGFEMLGRLLTQRRQIADVEVIVKSDDTIAFNDVIGVVDFCYGHRFTKVGFAVEE